MNNTTTSINSVQANFTDEKSWQCYGWFSGDIRRDGLYYGNRLVIVLVTGSSIMTSLSLNFLIMYILYKNKSLRRSTTFLVGILACVNLFATISTQLPFIVYNGYILTGVSESQYTLFCRFVWLFAFMGGLSILYSVTCVFGITVERYIAVFHPHYYRENKVIKKIAKIIASVLLLQTIHVSFNIAIDWYNGISKVLESLQVAGVLVFVCVAYAKIHYKLKRLFEQGNQESEINIYRQKRVTVTSALAVSAFFICFLPLTVLQVVGIRLREERSFLNTFIKPWLIVLLFMTPSINPILYGCRDARLGTCMKNTLKPILNVVFERNKVQALPSNHALRGGLQEQ